MHHLPLPWFQEVRVYKSDLSNQSSSVTIKTSSPNRSGGVMVSSHIYCLLTWGFIAAESIWLGGGSSVSQYGPGRSHKTSFYEHADLLYIWVYESLLYEQQ